MCAKKQSISRKKATKRDCEWMYMHNGRRCVPDDHTRFGICWQTTYISPAIKSLFVHCIERWICGKISFLRKSRFVSLWICASESGLHSVTNFYFPFSSRVHNRAMHKSRTARCIMHQSMHKLENCFRKVHLYLGIYLSILSWITVVTFWRSCQRTCSRV